MSVNTLAEKTKISRAKMFRIAKGETLPDIKDFCKILKVLDVPFKRLINL